MCARNGRVHEAVPAGTTPARAKGRKRRAAEVPISAAWVDVPGIHDRAQIEQVRVFHEVLDGCFTEVFDAVGDAMAPLVSVAVPGAHVPGTDELMRDLRARLQAAFRDAFRQDAPTSMIAMLRDLGGVAARTGISFSDLEVGVAALRTAVLGHLFDRFMPDHVDDLHEAILGKAIFIGIVVGMIGDEFVRAREEEIAQQQAVLREVSNPVLELRDGLLLLPLVGAIDSERAREMSEKLLNAIRSTRCRVVLVDVTGVPMIDTSTAANLMRVVAAARLMGATSILSGLSPQVAQSLVRLGVDLGSVRAVASLRDAVEEAQMVLEQRVARLAAARGGVSGLADRSMNGLGLARSAGQVR